MSQVIKFEKVVPEGKAMGHLNDGRAVFCIGPLPDEVAEIGVRKQKKTYAEAVLRKILEPSPHRKDTTEDHYMVCSPWQGVDYKYQCKLKHQMLIDAFSQQHIELGSSEIVGADEQFSYRNRLDFTVATIEGKLHLAFHQRGSWEEFVMLPAGCRLGKDRLNAAALNLLAQLNIECPNLPESVITVRHAHTTDQILTILTTTAKANWKHIDTAALGNFIVARPLPGSGAPSDAVFTAGQTFITEKLDDLDIAYPYDGFFQANTPMFEKALCAIQAAVKDAERVVELYSGVGAIGLPLAKSGKIVTGIETVSSAVEFAERNARANDIETYSAMAVAAERMDASLLEGADCVIVDPPRAGLHPRVVNWLLTAAPKQIIYLSCNPVTQARDISNLKPKYNLDSLTGYDFYPGALHLESLAVLSHM